jgi:ArsR family transcriptional regulator
MRPVEGSAADDELVRLAKAMAHPARVHIVRILSHQEVCMYGDLAEAIPLAQSSVSQHLKILKEAGLIRGEVEGPRVCYCIDWHTLRRLKALFAAL